MKKQRTGEWNGELHCLSYFEDGKCPKRRWKSKYCPLNIVPNGYLYCCENKKDE